MSAIEKFCTRCGVDVSARARTKDQRGRYYCAQCSEVMRAVGEKARSAGGERQGDDGVGYGLSANVAEVMEAPRPVLCPACAHGMGADAVICLNCGYNARAGFQRGSGAGATERTGGLLKCRHCGYDVTGLKSPTCPECGGRLAEDRRARDREVSREVVRWAYLRPGLMVVGGVAGLCVIRAIGGEAGLIPSNLLALALGIPMAVGAFFLCCLIWIGFDAPWHLVTLRMAGIFAVMQPISLLAGLIPVPVVPTVVTALCYMGLVQSELDVDLQDAVGFTIVMTLVQVFVVVAIAAVVQRWF